MTPPPAPPPPPPGPIVGIDLGTTNSLVAVCALEGGRLEPRVIPDDAGRVLLPSVVRFEVGAGGRAVAVAVGEEARRTAVEFPLTTVASVKRLMGRSAGDAAGDAAYLSYSVVEGAHGTARVLIPAATLPSAAAGSGGDAAVSPQEVSAHILRRLKGRASAHLGREVRRAVVTVPAYFDDAQRQATRDAGRLAGLDVVRIVNEPTAAALAYGLGLRGAEHGGRAQTIAVYDLGGGTFDISILRLTPSPPSSPSPPPPGGAARADAAGAAGADFFQVISTAGDTHLGGDDFDHAIVRLFTDEIRAMLPGAEDVRLEPGARRALLEFAEQAKVRLSSAPEAHVRIDLGDGRAYERVLTRDEFEELIAPLVERTLAACRRALGDAARALGGDAPPEIDCIVLVGGATRTPLVRRRVQEFFAIQPYTAVDPDEAVALGAAIQGAIISGEARSALLVDVVPLSLGIETAGGAMAKLILRNSAVPTRASEMFSTSVDGQTSIKLHVLQGEREMAADCRSLGVFHLGGIPPMPAGIPRLRVTFQVDANGVLSVSAVEERSGKRASLQVVPSHGLTREEVERIERESVEHAREDMTRHRVVDLVQNARLDLHWTGRALERVRRELDPAYLAELEAAIGRTREFVARAAEDWAAVNPDEFHEAKEALDRISVRLHETAISQSLRGTA